MKVLRMEGRVIAVVVAAGVFGFIAIVLGFVGEAKRIKTDEVTYSADNGYCYYPITSAPALGIASAILLLIYQIVISVGVGCFCCSRRPCPKECGGICSIISFVFSWLFFISAFTNLIRAAVLNNMNFLMDHYSNDDDLCPVANPGLFAVAGVLCLFTVALGFLSYFLVMCSRNKGVGQLSNDQGVAMGQPQLPKEGV
ncbi:uncharacterized protein LOC141617733 [Silene latifolia]|uniref:uncharacterized protein LOC141617733 n=1 Tax=Silene latifolia TaxID=37657 RepID=UPI003D77931E